MSGSKTLNEDQREALASCITETGMPGLTPSYRGKVRDLYELGGNRIAIVVTDRISAFDHIMKQAIPYKGQILNLLSRFAFEKVSDIVPVHLLEVPHPNVTIARKCEPIPIEVVIRACLTGHAWRTYRSGERLLCGVPLPEGMVEHQKFEEPILTPATKAAEGHDEDISEEEILRRGIVAAPLWKRIRETAFELFRRGSRVAAERGLILVDTKYEFGLDNGVLTLIDEVHTSDSSRYFHADGYDEKLRLGEPQKQLSKEFLREWLIGKGFRGHEGETLPDLPDRFRWEVYERYCELFETLTGEQFEPVGTVDFNSQLKEILATRISGG